MGSLFGLFRSKRDCRDFGQRAAKEMLKAAHVMAPRIAGASNGSIGDDGESGDAVALLDIIRRCPGNGRGGSLWRD